MDNKHNLLDNILVALREELIKDHDGKMKDWQHQLDAHQLLNFTSTCKYNNILIY